MDLEKSSSYFGICVRNDFNLIMLILASVDISRSDVMLERKLTLQSSDNFCLPAHAEHAGKSGFRYLHHRLNLKVN